MNAPNTTATRRLTRATLTGAGVGIAALALVVPLSVAAVSASTNASASTISTSSTVSTAQMPQAAPATQSAALTTAATSNATIREAQQRMIWAAVYGGPITGTMTTATKASTKRFQGKFLLAQDGIIGPKTMAALRKVTANKFGVDKRCLATGHFICADKTQKILRNYVNGKLQGSADVRFGRKGMETTNGARKVSWKSRDHVSSLYNAPMPYALFFYKGEAVHFSPDFVNLGYRPPGGSHGCINLRDKNFARQLFDSSTTRTTVVVYSS